jgi:hypothetical protein
LTRKKALLQKSAAINAMPAFVLASHIAKAGRGDRRTFWERQQRGFAA